MKYMFGVRTPREQAHRRGAFVGTGVGSQPGASKHAVVGCGVLLPAPVPVRDMCQLHAKHRCLNGIHASVPAEFVMVVAPRSPMIAELLHVLGHLRTGSGDDSRVSGGAHVLGGIKTEGGSYTERAPAAPGPLGANRLGGVLDNCDSEFVRVLLCIFSGVFLDCAVECVQAAASPATMHGK